MRLSTHSRRVSDTLLGSFRDQSRECDEMLTMRVFLLVILALSGCKKSSKEFYEGQRRYDVLVAREGDDAFLTAEMGEVSQALSAVPSNAIEKPKADALVAKIASERARIEAARAADARAQAAAEAAAQNPPAFPVGMGTRPPEPPKEVAVVAAVDAGAAEPFPFGGMSLAEFRKQFGSCVRGETTFDRGGELVPAFPVVESAECERRMKAPPGSLMIFVGGKLMGTATLSAAGRATLDAGAPGATTRTVDGPSFLVVPGAPIPPGYTSPPGAPVAPGPQGQGSDSLQPRRSP